MEAHNSVGVPLHSFLLVHLGAADDKPDAATEKQSGEHKANYASRGGGDVTGSLAVISEGVELITGFAFYAISCG